MPHAPASIIHILAAEDFTKLEAVIDKAGPIAGLFVLFLGIALFLLFKSMSKQLKKVNPDLPMGKDDILQAQDREVIAEAMQRGEREQQG
jgi:hypothetical protein